jgi:hypothetical protein
VTAGFIASVSFAHKVAGQQIPIPWQSEGGTTSHDLRKPGGDRPPLQNPALREERFFLPDWLKEEQSCLPVSDELSAATRGGECPFDKSNML